MSNCEQTASLGLRLTDIERMRLRLFVLYFGNIFGMYLLYSPYLLGAFTYYFIGSNLICNGCNIIRSLSSNGAFITNFFQRSIFLSSGCFVSPTHLANPRLRLPFLHLRVQLSHISLTSFSP